MLTSHPHVVISRPPRRIRKPKAKPSAQPAAVIVGRKVAPAPPTSPEDHDARAEAAAELWRELVRRASGDPTD